MHADDQCIVRVTGAPAKASGQDQVQPRLVTILFQDALVTVTDPGFAEIYKGAASASAIAAHGPMMSGTGIIRVRKMCSGLHRYLADQLNPGMELDGIEEKGGGARPGCPRPGNRIHASLFRQADIATMPEGGIVITWRPSDC
jgi:hypothetical protein